MSVGRNKVLWVLRPLGGLFVTHLLNNKWVAVYVLDAAAVIDLHGSVYLQHTALMNW